MSLNRATTAGDFFVLIKLEHDQTKFKRCCYVRIILAN